MLIQNLNTF